MRPFVAALMIVLYLATTAFGRRLEGKRTIDGGGVPLVEVSLGTEVSFATVGIRCDLPRMAPMGKIVRFFKVRKPLRRAVVAVVKAKPVRTFLERRKPVRRIVWAAARVALFPFRRCR